MLQKRTNESTTRNDVCDSLAEAEPNYEVVVQWRKPNRHDTRFLSAFCLFHSGVWEEVGVYETARQLGPHRGGDSSCTSLKPPKADKIAPNEIWAVRFLPSIRECKLKVPGWVIKRWKLNFAGVRRHALEGHAKGPRYPTTDYRELSIIASL